MIVMEEGGTFGIPGAQSTTGSIVHDKIGTAPSTSKLRSAPGRFWCHLNQILARVHMGMDQVGIDALSTKPDQFALCETFAEAL